MHSLSQPNPHLGGTTLHRRVLQASTGIVSRPHAMRDQLPGIARAILLGIRMYFPGEYRFSLSSRASAADVQLSQASLINRTAVAEDLGEAKDAIANVHGRGIMQALLTGFAAVAPRSTTPNLVEVLSTLVSRYPVQSKAWMTDILFSVSNQSHRRKTRC